jgi:hypothetical protein
MKDMSRNRSSDKSRSTTRAKSLPNFLLTPNLLYTHLIAKTWCILVFYVAPANGMKILGV